METEAQGRQARWAHMTGCSGRLGAAKGPGPHTKSRWMPGVTQRETLDAPGSPQGRWPPAERPANRTAAPDGGRDRAPGKCTGGWAPGSDGSGTEADAKVGTPDAAAQTPGEALASGDRLPGRGQSADAREEHGRLDLHVQPQGQAPVIPFDVARASGVLEIQDSFQGLKRGAKRCQCTAADRRSPRRQALLR